MRRRIGKTICTRSSERPLLGARSLTSSPGDEHALLLHGQVVHELKVIEVAGTEGFHVVPDDPGMYVLEVAGRTNEGESLVWCANEAHHSARRIRQSQTALVKGAGMITVQVMGFE